MKSVLITGASGYIAAQLYAYLSERGYIVRAINLRGGWAEESLHGFDTVIHTAGLAHTHTASDEAYYAVNRDLTLEVARAAKEQGVKQFIFMSSMSVYGLHVGHITADSKPNPVTPYGASKLQAEEGLCALQDGGFNLAVLRPPMIYGKGCKGNYPRLASLILKLPVFPSVHNERSMLYIGCLCGFMARLIESGEGGLYFPQNKRYVSTDELAALVAASHGKRLRLIRGFGWLIRLMSRFMPDMGKVFGSLTYDTAMSAAFGDEPQPDFAETIRLTEG